MGEASGGMPHLNHDDQARDTTPESWYDANIDVGRNLLDDLANDAEWLRSLRMNSRSQRIVDLGRRIDAANAERERIANVLGRLAKVLDGRGRLDVDVVAALKVVAKACDVSPPRFRAVVDALDRGAS
jgi:hypothetical protein